jgi:hypothetical protein
LRLVRSLILGTGAAVSAFILSALALAVLGIAQSGHGRRAWTDTRLIDSGGVHLSLADVIGLAAAACAALLGFALMYRKP